MATAPETIPGVTEIAIDEAEDVIDRSDQTPPDRARPLYEILTTNIDCGEVNVCLASARTGRQSPDFRLLKMGGGLRERFRSVVAATLQDLHTQHWQIRDYDSYAVIRREEAEIEYASLAGLAEASAIKERLAPLTALEQMEYFAQDEGYFVKNLRFYVIIIDIPNTLPLYCLRSFTVKKAMMPNRSILATVMHGEYNLLEEPPISFEEDMDVLIRGEHVYILEKGSFHRLFPDFEPMIENAGAMLTTINARFPIRGFERFVADCKKSSGKIAKLNRIVKNPYFAALTFDDLRRVVERYNDLDGIIGREPDGTEILHYRAGEYWKILNLLADDYLESRMTTLQYESNSKRLSPARGASKRT